MNSEDHSAGEFDPTMVPLPSPATDVAQRRPLLGLVLRSCDATTLLTCLRVNKLFNALALDQKPKIYFNVTLKSDNEALDLGQLATYDPSDLSSRDSSSTLERLAACLRSVRVVTLHAHDKYAFSRRFSYHSPLGDALPNIQACRVVNTRDVTRDRSGVPEYGGKICPLVRCPWLDGMSFSKVVYRTLGRTLFDPLVATAGSREHKRYTFFVPMAGGYRGWTPLQHSWDDRRQDYSGRPVTSPNGLVLGPDTFPEWIASHNEDGFRVAKTIVFGPPRSTVSDPDTISPLGQREPPLTLVELKELLLWSTSEDVTMVYGLERVQVVPSLDSRNWWIRDHDDWQKHNSYIPQLDVVREISELAAQVQPRPGQHYRFATIEQYLDTDPVDELFAEELDSESGLSKSGWNYWMRGGAELRAAARDRAWHRRQEKVAVEEERARLAKERRSRKMAKAEHKERKKERKTKEAADEPQRRS